MGEYFCLFSASRIYTFFLASIHTFRFWEIIVYLPECGLSVLKALSPTVGILFGVGGQIMVKNKLKLYPNEIRTLT